MGANGTVLLSEDGALNWAPQRSHAYVGLYAVVALRDHIVAVGDGGMVSPLTAPVPASPADAFRFAVEGETLTVAWRYPPGQKSLCNTAFYHLLGTGQPERQLGVPVLPLPAENDRIGFSVTWSPRAELRAEKGSQFSYAVDSTDPVLHVTWRQELPGVQPYLPQISGLIRAWAMVAGLSGWLQALLTMAGLINSGFACSSCCSPLRLGS